MYGVGFTAGSLAGKGARGGTRGTEDKVNIDKELVEVGRVAEGDRGGAWKKVASGGIREEDMVTFFEDTPQRMKARVVGSH